MIRTSNCNRPQRKKIRKGKLINKKILEYNFKIITCSMYDHLKCLSFPNKPNKILFYLLLLLLSFYTYANNMWAIPIHYTIISYMD